MVDIRDFRPPQNSYELPEPPAPDLREPFIQRREPAPIQTLRVRAICQIIVAGRDVTSFLSPHLINVHIIDKSPSAEATIELDDRDGKLPLPPYDAPVSIKLGWRYENMHYSFVGYVKDIEHGFGRTQGGRRMWIHCLGAMLGGPMKNPRMNTVGNGAEPGQEEGEKHPAQEIFEKAMKDGGMNGLVHKSLNQMRDHWIQNNEGGLQYAQRLADQVGGILKLSGNDAEITVKGENAKGQSNGELYAVWGVNLIGWRVHISARDNNSGSGQQSYNHQTGQWDFAAKIFGFAMNPPGGEGGKTGNQAPAANESNAGQDNDAKQNETSDTFGDGRIIINGEPRAIANSYVYLRGARPGIDGKYHVFSVEHIYSREGYITWLDVRPGDGTGNPGGPNVGDGMEWYDKEGIYRRNERPPRPRVPVGPGGEEVEL